MQEGLKPKVQRLTISEFFLGKKKPEERTSISDANWAIIYLEGSIEDGEGGIGDIENIGAIIMNEPTWAMWYEQECIHIIDEVVHRLPELNLWVAHDDWSEFVGTNHRSRAKGPQSGWAARVAHPLPALLSLLCPQPKF